MDVEIINPFIEALKNVLSQMMGLNATLGKLYLRKNKYENNMILIIVGITGEKRGRVVFAMGEDTAKYMASKMMGGMPVNELDELSKSAISELTNMTMGSSATIFYNQGLGIEISPPSLINAEMLPILPNEQVVCVPVAIDDQNTIELGITIN